MSATKNFAVGSVFGLEDGMTQPQIKSLEWMYSVKTTMKKVQANLESFWEHGAMKFRATKSIRRGDKFILFDGDTTKSPNTDDSNSVEDSESEKSGESDDEWNASIKLKSGTRKSLRRPKPNRNYAQKDNLTEKEDNSDEYEKETSEDEESSFEVRSSRRKSASKSFRESNSEDEGEIRTSGDEEEAFACKTCSKVFSNAPALKEHKKKHGPGIKMHSCNLCDLSFVYATSLETHLKEEHKEKSGKDGEKREKRKKSEDKKEKSTKKEPPQVFKCDECGKEFRWETSYDDHRAIHRKDFVCKICQKVFGKKIFLENHEASHKNEKNKNKAEKKRVNGSSDEESEDEEPKLGRGKRKRKSVMPSSRFARNRRENAKKINYSMEEEEESDDEVKATPKKRAKIDLDRNKIRSCYVKLERLGSNDDDLHKCFKCEKVYKNERQWLSHMKKFHS